MKVQARLERLLWAGGGFPPPGQLDLAVAVPVGCGMADGLPPGVHFNADGQVATMVFEGEKPGPSVMARLEGRLVPWGRVVTSNPEQPRPRDAPGPRSASHAPPTSAMVRPRTGAGLDHTTDAESR